MWCCPVSLLEISRAFRHCNVQLQPLATHSCSHPIPSPFCSLPSPILTLSNFYPLHLTLPSLHCTLSPSIPSSSPFCPLSTLGSSPSHSLPFPLPPEFIPFWMTNRPTRAGRVSRAGSCLSIRRGDATGFELTCLATLKPPRSILYTLVPMGETSYSTPHISSEQSSLAFRHGSGGDSNASTPFGNASGRHLSRPRTLSHRVDLPLLPLRDKDLFCR